MRNTLPGTTLSASETSVTVARGLVCATLSAAGAVVDTSIAAATPEARVRDCRTAWNFIAKCAPDSCSGSLRRAARNVSPGFAVVDGSCGLAVPLHARHLHLA